MYSQTQGAAAWLLCSALLCPGLVWRGALWGFSNLASEDADAEIEFARNG